MDVGPTIVLLSGCEVGRAVATWSHCGLISTLLMGLLLRALSSGYRHAGLNVFSSATFVGVTGDFPTFAFQSWLVDGDHDGERGAQGASSDPQPCCPLLGTPASH